MRKKMKIKDELKTKISIDNVKYSIDAFEQSDFSDKKMRVYLFPKNESVFENLLSRRARNKSLWRKMTLQILEKFGYNDVKISFSQRAGCQCGCSPGFIVDVKNGKELFITYNRVKK